MKLYPALAAFLALAAFPAGAQARGGCVAYGDEETDFTWRLCPHGEKYERRYLYYGAWTGYYRVGAGSGACDWSAARSSWICPDKTVRCDGRRCGLR